MNLEPEGLYFDREGRPATFEEWHRLFARGDGYRIVLRTVGIGGNVVELPNDGALVPAEVAADWLVSTVWLGIDHGHVGSPPLIFETMIFGIDGEEYQERYSTEAEAIAGHERGVAYAVKSGKKPKSRRSRR